MDKEVCVILKKYLKRGASIDDLQGELSNARCIIYKSVLPPVNGQPVQHIDATPDKNYPLRILQAYRQNCECQWTDTTNGDGAINPLFKIMNETCDKRAKLLDGAISILRKGG